MKRSTPNKLDGIDPQMFATVWARTSITLESIAAALGVHVNSVSNKARALRLPDRRKLAAPRVDRKEFADMYYGGVSLREMAQHFGWTAASTATHYRRLQKLPPRPRRKNVPLVAYLKHRRKVECPTKT